jgi:hypothetical protein
MRLTDLTQQPAISLRERAARLLTCGKRAAAFPGSQAPNDPSNSHYVKEGRKPKLQTQQRFNNRNADILVGIGLFALQQADKNVGAPA